MVNTLSPSVVIQEINLSANTPSIASSIGAIVFQSAQGPMAPTFITNTQQFLALYGTPNPAISYGHYSALAFLTQSSSLWVQRVTGASSPDLYAGLFYHNDKDPTFSPSTTYTRGFSEGKATNHVSGFNLLSLLEISAPLVTSNQIQVSISNSTTTVTAGPTTFSTDSNTTLSTFASSIQTQINSLGSNGIVEVINVSPVKIQQEVDLNFSTALITGNSTSGTVVVNGSTTNWGPVAFTTNSTTTMQAIATAIIAALGSGGNAFLLNGIDGTINTSRDIIVQSPNYGPNTLVVTTTVTGGSSQPSSIASQYRAGAGVTDNRIIRVINPDNTQLTFSAFTITSGASQATTSFYYDSKLFDVFAQNPGAWGNNIGVQVTNIDVGVQQQQTLTFSGVLVTGNTINMQINGFNIAPITFTTSHNNTMSLLATAILNTLNSNVATGGNAVVNVVAGATNYFVLTITAPISGTNVTISNIVVTGGASQPNIIVATSLNGRISNNTFKLSVFNSSNINVPLETFTVSLGFQVDGNGNQQNIQQVINQSASKSQYIRIYQPSWSQFTTATAVPPLPKLLQPDTTINFLTNGALGATVASSDVIAGWTSFSSPDTISVRILINGGYTASAVQQYMDSIARSRLDCICVLDMPSQYQDTSSDCVLYRTQLLNIDSSYSAIYAPDLQIIDQYTNQTLYVPPSGYIAATYALTDNVTASWFSPAGLNRGLIPNVIGVRTKFTKGDLDLMYPNQINAIVLKSSSYASWGDKTLASQSSALSYVPVRRLLITVEVSIANALNFDLFEPNDDFTRFRIIQMINQFMQPIKDAQGVYDFLVQSDSKNNPTSLTDQGIMVVTLFIKPVIPAEIIILQSCITNSGANFQEIISGSGNL